MPGLIRGAARVATGVAVAGGVRHHQEQKYAAQDAAAQQQAAPEPQYAPAPAPVYAAPAPAPAAPAADDLGAQLQQLADLHAQGVLTDEEFADAKAKLLG
jgi:hypothetical protein